MIRRLLLALVLAATLPGFRAAAAQEITWQDVAQSMFIIAGTPVPYESELLSNDDFFTRRALRVENPQFLKGGEWDRPVLLLMPPQEPILWNQPAIFFLRDFTVKEGAGKREFFGNITWNRHEGWHGLDYGPAPRPFSEKLATRIEALVAQNEHYRQIGAAYEPADDDPLLAEIKNDLQEIAEPIDFSEGVYKEKIAPHSLAIRRLLYRGEEIVPRLVSLLDSKEPFPAKHIIADPTHFQWTDIGPPPPASSMAEAIDILLGYWSGSIFGFGKSLPVHQSVVALWQTYLGYQLSGVDPSQIGQVDWKLAALNQFIIEGTLVMAEDPLDQDIYDRTSRMEATLSEPRFLKGEDLGAPYRIDLEEHWVQRLQDIESKVVVFSGWSGISTTDQKRFYTLTYAEGHGLEESVDVDYAQLDSALAALRAYQKGAETFEIDAEDSYWSKLKSDIESVASAPKGPEFAAAVLRVIEYGEPAVPYLVSLLADQEPWSYGRRFSNMEGPWPLTAIMISADSWEDLAAELLREITEHPVSARPSGYSLSGAKHRSDYWKAYFGQRLSTAEGRLALSHDPIVSRAEALRQAIAAELRVGAGRQEIEGFLRRHELRFFYDEIDNTGKTAVRYQAVVPDANPDDELDETVVVHVFLDESYRMTGSDVRYLFDLYR